MKQASIVIVALSLLTAVLNAQPAAPPPRGAGQQAPTGAEATPCSCFAFTDEVTIRCLPGNAYDAMTGDISPWWDHSFSPKPYKLYIEPKPGGGFYEIFSANGDGALHATVTYAERGKKLRFVGPLGLAGKAIDMVTTLEFAAAGKDSTRLTISVHASGEIGPGLEAGVRNVWKHFLIERFKPYAESGAVRQARP